VSEWLGEWLPAGVLALLAATGYAAASRQLDARLAQTTAANVWFDSDLPYRLEVMVRPGGWDNGGAHPLFPTLGHLLLAVATPAEPDAMRAAGFAGAAVGALFVVLLYALFRRMRLERVDAALFAAIGAASSGAIFWFPVPESFGLAGVGVAIALLVAAQADPSRAALAAAVAASAASVLTNGVVGCVGVAVRHPRPRQWGRGAGILLLALGGMTAVWALQEWSFATPYFLGDRLLEYRQHTFPVSLERTLQVARGLFVHSVVGPALHNDRPSFRAAEIGSSGPLGALAAAAWLALLALGIARSAAALRSGPLRPLAATAMGSLLLMLAMHLTLGREMFLYALDVLPLLLVTAAGSATVPRGRALVRTLAVVLLAAGLMNNVHRFTQAAGAAREVAARRVAAPPGVSEPR
jgi:hypothetical protein